MNYYHPAEMKNADGGPSGMYHFVCQTEHGPIYPVGYCATGCPGHDTPDGAREHYREWELDNARYDGSLAHTQERCEVCGAWTQRLTMMPDGYRIYTLCDEHCNRDELAKLHESGDFWEGAE